MSRISIVTPTLHRPKDIAELLVNLAGLTIPPLELIIVDAAPAGDDATAEVVRNAPRNLPYGVEYIRRGGGTAIQRNIGIDRARGDYIAFIDDDVRLEPDFFERKLEVYAADTETQVGGIAGYITNQFLDPAKSPRWKWYRRMRLFSTYEPGRYDYKTGYPINRYLQPPHSGVREIDFMGSNCALWRRQVFDAGLRFDEFFRDYGVLEDAHFALRAGRRWKILECGLARCAHLRSPGGRVNSRKLASKTAVNYRFVFVDLVPERTFRQELRFWSVQYFDLFRIFCHALGTRTRSDWLSVLGKAEGIVAAVRVKPAPVKP
jgi:glycosyltransferase involved in cell wall biosynthesis